ncbi:LacI family DNA-binding transcriptional regulator [Lachnospiraceae bacterium 54-53]
MKIRSKDIAKQLGLSEATVSMAINNRSGVSMETRKRVLRYVEELKAESGENPEAKERVLRMFAFIEDRPFWDASEETRVYTSYMEAGRAARELGYRLDFVHIYKNKDDFRKILMESEQEGIMGIFLNAAYMKEEDYECFQGIKIPFIVADQDFEDSSKDSILLNNRQGVRQGLNYLWENGHRDILYFRNSHDFFNMYQRRDAYGEYMAAKNCGRSAEIIDIGGSTQEVYDRMLAYIREGKRLPTAVFSENYEVTIGLSNALVSSGIRIPEDVSIVGFDELPGTAILSFKPVCIRALHARKARIAVERLVDRVEGRTEEAVQILINTELVPGNSVNRIY